MLFGAHVSVGKGYSQALEYACSIGAECLQFFAKSPRQWLGPGPDVAACESFIGDRESQGFGPVFTHTAYLLNLTSLDEALKERSTLALADELVRSVLVGAAGVVTHIGNDPDANPAAASKRAAGSILRAFELAGESGTSARLLLENTAGAGASFGASVDELVTTIEATGMTDANLGVCIDTCHAFAYGYALDSADGCIALVDEIAEKIGLERLGLIHLNDCMFEKGAKRDRHAWIGDGLIGEEGFKTLVCDPRLETVPGITEMPGEVPDKDVTNLTRLRAMRDACGRSGQ